MKIVSVMTTHSAGGAEFAAVEMLDALAERGHDVVMLSDMPGIGRGSRVPVVPLEIGPKLSSGTWPSLLVRWPALARGVARALGAQLPYDVLLVHYKKEQLVTDGCHRVCARCSCGPNGGRCPIRCAQDCRGVRTSLPAGGSSS